MVEYYRNTNKNKMFFFNKNKKSEEVSRTTPGFEETERRTPKTGAILLLLMFVAGLFFGWRALDDLALIPPAPQALSECSYRYGSSYVEGPLNSRYKPTSLSFDYQYLDYAYTNCNFNDLELGTSIPNLVKSRQDLQKQLQSLSTQIQNLENSLNQVRTQIGRLTGEYGVGLQEKGLKVPNPVFQTEPTAQSLSQLREAEASLLNQQAGLTSQKSVLESQIESLDKQLKEAYKPVFEKQNGRLRVYDFWVFLLQLVFVLPLFWFTFKKYRELHGKDSPYSIILTAVLAVVGILLLRVILYWFYDLFLAQVIEVLWRWIQNFELLRSIVFYVGMILSFLIFGGAVYYLQKKIFDPRRVAIRRFRAHQCPNCQASLDLSKFYCPNCAHQLKEKCEKCGEPRFVELPACPNCGMRK